MVFGVALRYCVFPQISPKYFLDILNCEDANIKIHNF